MQNSYQSSRQPYFPKYKMKTYRYFTSLRRIHVATRLVQGDVNSATRGTSRTLTSKYPIGRAHALKLDGHGNKNGGTRQRNEAERRGVLCTAGEPRLIPHEKAWLHKSAIAVLEVCASIMSCFASSRSYTCSCTVTHLFLGHFNTATLGLLVGLTSSPMQMV